MIAISPSQSIETHPHDRLAGQWQPPVPRRRSGVRGGQLMAVHDSTLMCGFDLTPVVKIASDRHGGHYPLGLHRGRLVRLDRYSSERGYYCGLIVDGDDPRAAADRHDLTVHYLTRSYIDDGQGYGEDMLEDALADLDNYPITGGWGR